MRSLLVALFFCLFCNHLTIAQRVATIGSAQTFLGSSTWQPNVTAINDSHILITYRIGNNLPTGDLMAVIGQVDTATKTIAYGTPSIIVADSHEYVSAEVLTDSTAVIAYEDRTGGTETGMVRIIEFNLSTDAITSIGSPSALDPEDIYFGGWHKQMDLVKLTNEKFAILWGSGDSSMVRVGTISGSVISFGSAYTLGVTFNNNFWLTALDSTKLLISNRNNVGNNSGFVILVNISGNTILPGSVASFESSNVGETACEAINDTQAVVMYGKNGFAYAKVVTVNGNSITISSERFNLETSQTGASYLTADHIQGNEFIAAYQFGGSNPSKIRVGEVYGSGSAAFISFTQATTYHSSDALWSWVAAFNDDAFAVAYCDFSNGLPGRAVIGTLSEPACLLTASLSIDSAISCNGDSTGHITANSNGGLGFISYNWSTGDSTSVIDSLIGGTYTVTVTDNNGCTAIDSVELFEPDSLFVFALLDSVISCFGETDGGATAIAFGGTGALTYDWSNGETDSVITGLTADVYSITVTDANGCTDSSSTEIIEPDELIAVAVLDSNASCEGESDGGATVIVSGGTFFFDYDWSNGALDSFLTGLSAGTYSVTVTDFNGCTDSSSIEISEPDELIATALLDSNASCEGESDGGATVIVSGGTFFFDYDWSNGGLDSSITGLSAGTYSVTVTDFNGCTDSAAVLITEPIPFSVSAILDSNASCISENDGGATVITSGGIPFFDYDWSNGASDSAITGVGAGVYSVTVTDFNGCTDSSSVFIDAVDIFDPVASAQNLTVYLDATGQAIITAAQVDDGSIDNCGIDTMYLDIDTLDCSNVGLNIVSLTVVDSNGNSDAALATVTVEDTIAPVILGCPFFESEEVSSSCNFTLPDYTSSMTFLDSCGIQSVVQTPAPSTNVGTGITEVSIVATDVNGNTDTCFFLLDVFDFEAPIIACSEDTILANDPGECGAVYNFSTPSASDNCGIDTIIQEEGLESGEFFPIGSTLMTFVAFDTSGNADTCSFFVIVDDTELPIIECIGDTAICEEVFTYATPAAFDNCGVESLQLSSGLTSGSTFPIGTTVITHVATDSSGNQDSCSFTVTRNQEPSEANVGDDQEICDSTTAALNAMPLMVGTGTWKSLDGAIISDSTTPNPLVSNLSIGENEFVWTVSSGECAPISDTLVLEVYEAPSVAEAGDDMAICDQFSYTLEANEPEVGIGVWSSASSSTITDTINPSTDISDVPIGQNKFVWTISNGSCPPVADTIQLTVAARPEIELDTIYAQRSDENITIGANTIGQDFTYEWSPSSVLEDAFSESTTAYINESTEFTVIVSSLEGCSVTDTLFVRFPVELNVMTAFTPDGDGINDVWQIEGASQYPDMMVSVFNRWGNKVFQSDPGYKNKFDGTFKGKLLPVSSYYFLIDFNDNKTEPRDGNLTIIY